MIRLKSIYQTNFLGRSKISFFVLTALMSAFLACTSGDEKFVSREFKLTDSFDIPRERMGDLVFANYLDIKEQDSLLMIFNKGKRTVSLMPFFGSTLTNVDVSAFNQLDIFDRLFGIYHDGKTLFLMNDSRILSFSGPLDSIRDICFFGKRFADNYGNFYTKFRVQDSLLVLTGLLNVNLKDSLDRRKYHDSLLVTELRIEADSVLAKRHLPISFPASHTKDFFPSIYPLYQFLDRSGNNFVYTFRHWDSLAIVQEGKKSFIALPKSLRFFPKPLKESGTTDFTEYLIQTGGNTNFVFKGDSLLLFQVVKSENNLDENGELLTFETSPKRMLVFNLKDMRFEPQVYLLPANSNPFLSLIFKHKLYLFSELEDFKTRMYEVEFE